MTDQELAAEMLDPDLPSYREAEKGPQKIAGLFIFKFLESEFAGGQRPTFTTVDNGSIVLDDLLTIDGNSYLVRDDQPDGAGMTVFLLEAQ